LREDVLKLACDYLGSTVEDSFQSFIEAHALLQDITDSRRQQAAVNFVWSYIVNIVRTKEEPMWTALESAASDRARLDKLECEMEARNKRQRVRHGVGRGSGRGGAESMDHTTEATDESMVSIPQGLLSHTHARTEGGCMRMIQDGEEQARSTEHVKKRAKVGLTSITRHVRWVIGS
jgi:hypothetical protein